MVNFEIDQYTVCTYILNAHFSSNLCLQALYETSWEANLVITMCWEQARFSCWWQHLPRLVAAIKILCWLCGNHWLCRNCWFRLCRNLRVGAAGPPKYSTPWLLWTPINFYSLMPCPFTGPKMFCAGPKFLCQNKKLFTYCGSHKNFVPNKKMICIQ